MSEKISDRSLQFRIKLEDIKKLDKIAKDLDRSKAYLIRKAVEQFIKNNYKNTK